MVWQDLEGEKTVRVRYVPDKPSISQRARGRGRGISQQNDLGYVACAIGAAMSLAFLAFASLLAFGYSLDVDSKTGKVSIKPYGTGR